ncbi:hypothetical protein [Lacinutrix mariniflava]|uniref:hypothetical protein n=1 Tax=Lacinutrix mariniflava TaxID=342955 RepID=UPI0006E2D0C3|nr:hypothetical protein [Lacinutrix mariniflava]
MSDKNRKIFIALTLFISLLIVGLIIAKSVVKNKIENNLASLPEHVSLMYENVDINLLSGDVKLQKPLITIKGQTTKEINTQVDMQSLAIKGFSYWDYLFNTTLSISDLEFNAPNVVYYYNKLTDTDKGSQSVISKLKQTLNIKNIAINKGTLEVYNVENDSIISKINKIDFLMTNFSKDQSTKLGSLFNFETSSIIINGLEHQVGEFENLFVDNLKIDNNQITLSNLKFKTKYSKNELSKVIDVERDYFDLEIPKIEINNQKLDFNNTKLIGVDCDNIVINNPKFNIYRDKLVADDLVEKDLYSKMLRGLNFKLNINLIDILNGTISYEEKVKAEHIAGKLDFTAFNAKLTKISNTYLDTDKTKIDINCNFMNNTPLKVEWSFNVNNVNDDFVFKADLGNLNADSLNQFMKPNLNLKLEGELSKTFFTIDGNLEKSNVNLKTKYDKFNIIILKENGQEKNKLLSSIINVFVSESSKDKGDNFRNSDTKEVIRDKTKSVFNFVWKNTQAGLLSAMAGDGEKDD